MANTFYTLYCECILYCRSKHKHKKSCFFNARILESFYKKGKKIKKENEKVANQKLGKVGNLGNLGKVILSFRFCPTTKIENSDLKISQKNFQDFRDSRGFRVFDLAEEVFKRCFRSYNSTETSDVKTTHKHN